jgi:menaquinone-dependent protoporphyrinogen oxidase
MATLVVYGSQHGCTESCAERLAGSIKDATTLANLKQKSSIDLGAYDTILVGGSIHAGRIQGAVRSFCSKNLDVLLTKRLGLFLCCMAEEKEARGEFENAFPEKLREHATATGIFGGAFDFERMNFLERAIIKKVGKVDGSVSKIDEAAIDAFSERINRA